MWCVRVLCEGVWCVRVCGGWCVMCEGVMCAVLAGQDGIGGKNTISGCPWQRVCDLSQLSHTQLGLDQLTHIPLHHHDNLSVRYLHSVPITLTTEQCIPHIPFPSP